MENNPDFHGKAALAGAARAGPEGAGATDGHRPRNPKPPAPPSAPPSPASPAKASTSSASTPTSAYSTSAVKFGQEFPDRFFPVGVAEQNMIGVAAGFASCGKIAFCLQLRRLRARPLLRPAPHGRRPARARTSSSSPATPASSSARTAPPPRPSKTSRSCSRCRRSTSSSPPTTSQAEQAIETAARTDGPFYIRTLRPKTPIIYDDSHRFQLGKWDQLRDGTDVTLIAIGELVEAAVRRGRDARRRRHPGPRPQRRLAPPDGPRRAPRGRRARPARSSPPKTTSSPAASAASSPPRWPKSTPSPSNTSACATATAPAAPGTAPRALRPHPARRSPRRRERPSRAEARSSR